MNTVSSFLVEQVSLYLIKMKIGQMMRKTAYTVLTRRLMSLMKKKLLKGRSLVWIKSSGMW